MEKEYLPIAKVAKLLGVQTPTLKRWIFEFQIEHVVIPFRNKQTILIPKREIESFIERKTITPIPVKRQPGRPAKFLL